MGCENSDTATCAVNPGIHMGPRWSRKATQAIKTQMFTFENGIVLVDLKKSHKFM